MMNYWKKVDLNRRHLSSLEKGMYVILTPLPLHPVYIYTLRLRGPTVDGHNSVCNLPPDMRETTGIVVTSELRDLCFCQSMMRQYGMVDAHF
jgi:hypothetical protein